MSVNKKWRFLLVFVLFCIDYVHLSLELDERVRWRAARGFIKDQNPKNEKFWRMHSYLNGKFTHFPFPMDAEGGTSPKFISKDGSSKEPP